MSKGTETIPEEGRLALHEANVARVNNSADNSGHCEFRKLDEPPSLTEKLKSAGT